MKQVLICSIRPEHALNILSGYKTLELRKSVPKNFEGWVYIYCTKSKQFLHQMKKYILKEYPNIERFILNDDPMVAGFDILNGHVVARFWFDEYETYDRWHLYHYYDDYDYAQLHRSEFEKLVKDSCVEFDRIYAYSGAPYKDLYAWHIKKLEVFDQPMQLDEFYKDYDTMHIDGFINGLVEIGINPLQRPPQSFMTAWVKS